MSSPSDEEKLKRILSSLDNTDIPLDTFYEQMEKEFGNSVPFSKLKSNLENFYITISKSIYLLYITVILVDLYFLLSKVKINQKGLINLAELIYSWYQLLKINVKSAKCAFYIIAESLSKKKLSTIEFIYQQNLTLKQELNINEFNINIIDKLNVDSAISLIAFKGLDVQRKGKIKVEDFLIVIDSYREDNYDAVDTNDNSDKENNKNEDTEKKEEIEQLVHTKNKYNLSDQQIFWINKLCEFLSDIEITEKMAYDSVKIDAKAKEINLDAFKRKLKALSSNNLSAMELNNISDAFDINHNRFINYDDYSDVIDSCKHDAKYARLSKSNFNTYPLVDYLNSSQIDMTKLPFRTNKKFFTAKKPKIEEEIDTEKKNDLFNEDEAYNQGTNLAVDVIDKRENGFTLIKDNEKEMNEFLKELDVFESGEWSLIELIEDFDIFDNKEYAPSYELFVLMEKKFCPTINKTKISMCINSIDINKDGYISYLDLINFLLCKMQHRSSKIGWKEVTRSIVYGKNLSADEFFTKKIKCANSKDIVSFVEFTKVITGEFAIPPAVAKQMFDDLQSILSNHKITRGDIIDTVNRQIEFNRKKQKTKKKIDDVDDIYSKTNYMSSIARDIKEYSSVSLLDKKYYEQEMKNFVRLLQKAFVPSLDPNVKETLISNLLSFLHLPSKMKLNQFRELFIKPLSMNYALGISTFQLAKVFNNSNPNAISSNDTLASISTDTLMDLLSSYIDYNVTDFEPRLFLFYLENAKYPSLKFCFESLEYNNMGVSSIELLRHMQMFYPKIQRGIIALVIKKIDAMKKGVISYKNLSDFIFRFASKNENQYSVDLLLKHIAFIVDKKKINTEKYVSNVFKNKKYIDDITHDEFFVDELSINSDQSRNLFLYLNNVKNKKAYTTTRLISLIDSIRTNIIDSDDKNKVYVNENKTVSKSYTTLLSSFNSTVPICKWLHRLSLNPSSLSISVVEIINAIVRTYQSKMDIDRGELVKMIKKIDTEQKGEVYYVNLHKFLKAHLYPEFRACEVLHMEYIAFKEYSEFNGKWNDYISYKGMNTNKYVNKAQFEKLFKVDECLNDNDVVSSVFDFLSEKNKNNVDIVYLMNYIDYLKSLCRTKFDSNIIIEDDDIDMTFDEARVEIAQSITRLDNDGNNLSSVYDDINYALNANSFMKINWDKMKMYLFERFAFESKTLSAFRKLFCKVPNLFDLLKLERFIQDKSKFSIDTKDITKKITDKINSKEKSTLKDFCKNYNIDVNKSMSSNEFVIYIKAIFELSAYESVLLFDSIAFSDYNPNVEDMKVSMSYMITALKLKKYFVEDQTDDKADAISPLLNLALIRFSKYMRKNNVRELFIKNDTNNDKVLQRDEFFNMINLMEIDGVNEDMKVKMINYIDRNNDGVINYEELITFLNNFEDAEEDDYSINVKQSEIVAPVPVRQVKKENKYESVIDYKTLTSNYNFNRTQLDSTMLSSLNHLVIKLQESLLVNDNVNDDEYQSTSIEGKLYKNVEPSSPNMIQISSLSNVISNAISQAISDDDMNQIKTFSEANEDDTMINYKTFLINLVNYVFVPPNKIASKDEESKAKVNIRSKLNQKFKKRNREFGYYLKKNFGKEFNFNDEDQVNELKTNLLKTFSFSERQSKASKGISPQNLYTFKKFITNIVEAPKEKIFADYNYTNEDFYIRPYSPNEKCETILNSEEAALKKCEELYINAIETNTQFTDKEFGAINTKKSMYMNAMPSSSISPNDVAWYRIKDISAKASFLSSLSTSYDVIQGCLGDCWFISALAVIASKDYLLRGEFTESILDDGVIDDEEIKMVSCGIYPPVFHHFRERGIYCFKFYKNYKWRYVIIDDTLPCLKVNDVSMERPRLIYGKCRNNDEFWVALIEKAYAKLHGCYEKLNSGFIDDAIQDLTGLNTRRILLGEDVFRDNERMIDKTWNDLVDYTSDFVSAKNNVLTKFSSIKSMVSNILLDKNNSILACSVDAKGKEKQDVIYKGDKSGLISGHAYALLKAFEIPKPVSKKERKTSRLLLLKNPWGVKEWNGKWSDNSKEVEQNAQLILNALKVKLPKQKQENISEDGRFLISFSDFRSIFNNLFIAFQFSPKYIPFYFDDTWNDNAGGIPVENTIANNEEWSKNPQYALSIKKDTNMFISITQEDGRLNDDRFPFNSSIEETCLMIIRIKEKMKLKTFTNTDRVYISPLKRHRENSVGIKLEKGEYIVVCCARDKNSKKKFRLCVWAEDFFIDDEVNGDNFMSKMENVKMERIDKKINPVYINVDNEEKIEQLNDKKRRSIYLQMKHSIKCQLKENSEESSENN